jgi:Leucine-rich repeat (LRR) protein
VKIKSGFSIIQALILAILFPARAQEVPIPDPNLDAVILQTLQKPTGLLTLQDMLGHTNLSAISRSITNVQGLEAAQNMVSRDLQDNRITSVNILTNLIKLTVLDLSENRFPQLSLPRLTKLTSLRVGFNQLSNLILPASTGHQHLYLA